MSEVEVHKTKLIVPLIAGDPPLSLQVDQAMQRGGDIVELRADLIGDVTAIEDLLLRPRSIPYILTIRAAGEGGGWDGAEDERIALFERLGLHLPGYVDVEYAAWMRSANLRQKIGLVCNSGVPIPGSRAKNNLILSHHDFRRTPRESDLAALLVDMKKVPAAVYKIACHAAEASDGLCLLSLAAPGHGNLMVMGMSEGGLCTRVACRKLGLWGTYAALANGSESAPGQPSIDAMRRLYRWDAIDRETRFFGVIGWPVSHSRSPAIHNAAMAAAGINGAYLPMPAKPTMDSFRRLMDQMSVSTGRCFRGFSVTIPHKENAFAWLAENQFAISPIARRSGAVNTLTRTDGDHWTGDNTDAQAAWSLISEKVPDARHRKFLILGAGGVARGVLAALVEVGIEPIIVNRTEERAQRLSEEVGGAWRQWRDRANAAADVVINCTSVGMTPNIQDTPFPAAGLRPGMVVFDTVYTPADTHLLQDARARGCRTIDGAALFLQQAALQFSTWHGRPAPLEIMSSSLANP